MFCLGLGVCQVGRAQTVDASGLELTATILAQHDCKMGPEHHSLFLQVKLRLLNNGALPFEATLPLGGVVIISRTPADAGAGRHEFELNGPEAIIGARSETLPKTHYNVVRPGQAVESLSNNLQLVPTKEGDKHGLKPGRHYIQIQIGGFLGNPDSTEAPSRYQKVTSSPVPFDVESYPVPVDCSQMLNQIP